MPKKSSSSRRWLHEHFSDPYVKEAQKEGFRSRAVYKLKEINDRDKLFKPGMTIVDLGAAPGSWSELAVKLVGKSGRVIALDILPMDPIANVEFIQGDFTEEAIEQELLQRLGPTKVDWVISDMAPNFSGMNSVDIPRMMTLAELALAFALSVLNDQGGFLVKTFQGEGFDSYLRDIKTHFKKVVTRKPKASRGRSNEIYILARN